MGRYFKVNLSGKTPPLIIKFKYESKEDIPNLTVYYSEDCFNPGATTKNTRIVANPSNIMILGHTQHKDSKKRVFSGKESNLQIVATSNMRIGLSCVFTRDEKSPSKLNPAEIQ